MKFISCMSTNKKENGSDKHHKSMATPNLYISHPTMSQRVRKPSLVSPPPDDNVFNDYDFPVPSRTAAVTPTAATTPVIPTDPRVFDLLENIVKAFEDTNKNIRDLTETVKNINMVATTSFHNTHHPCCCHGSRPRWYENNEAFYMQMNKPHPPAVPPKQYLTKRQDGGPYRGDTTVPTCR